jgi:hypothetical protein
MELNVLAKGNHMSKWTEEPTLLLQGNPRQVVDANPEALDLFGKAIEEVRNHRGGQVFDCLHAFSEAGCGKDVHCEPCTIRKAIVDTLETGNAHEGVSSRLEVLKAGERRSYALQVSTRKVGELAQVRIERYEPDAGPTLP